MRRTRSNDWGFPRWRAYGAGDGTPEAQRRCDHEGCDQPGTCPAPKAPNRPERWWFCEAHAADYNRRWNYFEALDAAGARDEANAEQRAARGFRRAAHWAWGKGDGSRSQAELDALKLFDLPSDASPAQVKAAFRREAKASHPDTNPDDPAAAERFRAVQAAFAVLEAAARRG